MHYGLNWNLIYNFLKRIMCHGFTENSAFVAFCFKFA